VNADDGRDVEIELVQLVARMKQSGIRESLDSVLLHPGDNVFSFTARKRFSNGARVF
jgi:hypothetical protein